MITVASYNLYLGADLTRIFDADSPGDLRVRARAVHDQLVGTDFAARAQAVARVLARERPDLVGLQEVARWTRRRHGGPPLVWCDFLPLLLAALDAAGTPYDVHGVNENFHGEADVADGETIAVLGMNAVLARRDSAVAVTSVRTARFSSELQIPTRMPELVLSVPRSWSWVDATCDGRPVRFVNTHTEAYDAPVRDAQRDELLTRVGAPGHGTVVVGDFNAEPDRVDMPAAFVDAWDAAGAGPGYTCGQDADLRNPVSRLSHRIDYVWVRDATVTGCRVVGDRPEDRTATGLWPSDHAGVVADIELAVP